MPVSSGPTDVDYKQKRRWYEDPRPIVYVVLEVKTDGGDVRRNAIRSIAAVALVESGHAVSHFFVNVAPPEGTSADARTLQRYRDHGDAWQAMTTNAQRPSVAMDQLVRWVQSLPGQPVAVGTPLIQLSLWLETYLRRSTKHVFYRGPFEGDVLFSGGGIDLPSLVMGVTGLDYRQAVEHMLPADWRGGLVETHKARDDADMHAALLRTMLAMRAAKGPARA
jgi:hypothetical protein